MVLSDSNRSNGRPVVEEELLVAERNEVAIVTLNRPSKLNCLTLPMALDNQHWDTLWTMLEKMIGHYKKWEEDDSTKVVVLKGNGRVFCAGGDLNMFYRLGKSDEGWKGVVYVKYWFDYHLSTFKKPLVGILHGLVMGGGAGLTVLGRFRVATEKTIFAMPEVGIGFHPDCGASHWLSHLPGSLGEYLALLGARLDGADMYTSGLATHYVPVEKLLEMEQRLLELKSGDFGEVDAAIKEFNVPAKIGPNSIFNKDRQNVIERTFSKASVEEIIVALEAELKEGGQEWLKEPLKILKRSSPTALKVTLQSIRDGRKQTLPDAIQREYRLTINCLRAIISEDMYETPEPSIWRTTLLFKEVLKMARSEFIQDIGTKGIRAIVVEKDNAPKWKPATLEEVTGEMLDQMVHSFNEKEDLVLPSDGKTPRWHGAWEEKQQA